VTADKHRTPPPISGFDAHMRTSFALVAISLFACQTALPVDASPDVSEPDGGGIAADALSEDASSPSDAPPIADAGDDPLGCNPNTGTNAPLATCTTADPCTRPLMGMAPIADPAGPPPRCHTMTSHPFHDDGAPMAITFAAGSTRFACLYAPPAASPASLRPLVVWFHGSGGSADDVYDYTSLRSKAESAVLSGDASRPGYFLISIAARNLHWPGDRAEDGPKHDYFYRDLGRPSTNPDIANADAMIDRVVAMGGVDRSRIYASGWSDGAQFAELYAIARHAVASPGGSRIAAAAVYSGADPFNNIAASQTPSCALAPYPHSDVPIFIVSRACDIHPCDAQDRSLTALGLDPPPGATVSTWMQDLAAQCSDPNGRWEILTDRHCKLYRERIVLRRDRDRQPPPLAGRPRNGRCRTRPRA
jgi:predicted esterase